jgi:hypothetical protein
MAATAEARAVRAVARVWEMAAATKVAEARMVEVVTVAVAVVAAVATAAEAARAVEVREAGMRVAVAVAERTARETQLEIIVTHRATLRA